MNTTLLKSLLVVIAAAMLVLRVRAYGWFLLIFGIGFLLLSALHIYAGWVFINTMHSPAAGSHDLLLFAGMIFFHILFYLLQWDFNDAPDSKVIVLQFVIGKNRCTGNHWLKRPC